MKDLEKEELSIDINLHLEISPAVRLQVVEDFLLWCDKKECFPADIFTYLKYRSYLLKEVKQYD